MLDRITNVLVLLIIAGAVAAIAIAATDAWEATPLDDYEWTPREGIRPALKADVILRARQDATADGNDQATAELEDMLRQEYKSSAEPIRRFNSTEVKMIAGSFLSILAFVGLPIFLNYIRHGRFRLWNRGT